MKLSLSTLLSSRLQPAYQKALKNFFSSSSTSHTAPHLLNKRAPDSLYRRISPVGDHNISVVPVLDQWVREGRNVDKMDLQRIITELKVYKRFKHALEISKWMTDRRYIPLSQGDISNRMYLIYKVHGLEKVEEYYTNITQKMKGFPIYVALLNCYAYEKTVEKAEAIMQKLQDMGSVKTALTYNILMSLYYQVGSWEKLNTLMQEMNEKGIEGDKYTFSIRMSAYAARSNSNGIDMVMARIESDPQIVIDCGTYIVAANAYFKVGLVDKVLEMLNKWEELMRKSKKKLKEVNFVLRMYAKIGKKDELYRIWKLCKTEKIFNKGYMCMISSLLKIDDIEGAEKIFEEWESSGLSYDFRVPDFLIKAYVKKSHLEKAEVHLNQGIEKGGNPSFYTWFYLARGYIEDNLVFKAVEALKKAIPICRPSQKPIKDRLLTCLEYLERRGDVEEAEDFIKLLKLEGIFSETACERLLNFIKGENSNSSTVHCTVE